jgi:hypothetical protein
VLDAECDRIEDLEVVLEFGKVFLDEEQGIAVFCMVLALALDAFWSRPNGMRDFAIFRGLAEPDLQPRKRPC